MRQKKEKKGQAALEFLMTYGWAILVVLTVIGALAYFGVLNPTMLLPEKCTLQMGINCKNYVVVNSPTPTIGDQVWLELENNNQKGIYIIGLNVTSTDDTVDCGYSLNSTPNAGFYNQNYNGKPGIFIDVGKSAIINVSSSFISSIFNNCSTPDSGFGKQRSNIYVRWYYSDATPSFAHTASGEMLSTVESR